MNTEQVISLKNVLENQRVIRDQIVDHKTLLLIDEALAELIELKKPDSESVAGLR